jgi:hypothetical protein
MVGSLLCLLLAGNIGLFSVQAQEVHPLLAADLQVALEAIRSAKNVTGVSAAVIAPGREPGLVQAVFRMLVPAGK